jgi:type IV fimbrial biogenesis protein FimT
MHSAGASPCCARRPCGSAGFSLIELVVAMAVAMLLMALALPSYGRWLSNQRIRAQAEAVLSGLTLARSEAIKRNDTVRFQLVNEMSSACVPSTNASSWVVSLFPVAGLCHLPPDQVTTSTEPGFDPEVNPLILQAYRAVSAGQTMVTATAAQVCFNGLGQLSTAAGCAAGPIAFSVTAPGGTAACTDAGGPDRCMRTVVSAGGLVRLCDPAVTAQDDPRRC